MSYLRGEHYVWSDGEHLHMWVPAAAPLCENMEHYGAGISIPEHLADLLAVMRFAELLASGRASAAIESAAAVGNAGADQLRNYRDALMAFAQSLGHDPASANSLLTPSSGTRPTE